MKIRIAATAAALLAMAAPAAAADGALTYQSVTHCAAFNLLLAQVYSAGDQAAATATEIDTFSNQAAALMVVATAMNNSTTEQVQADVTAENDTMIASLDGDGAAEKLISDNMVSCTVMGQAAKETLDKMLAEKQ
jgi:hypothetical protein